MRIRKLATVLAASGLIAAALTMAGTANASPGSSSAHANSAASPAWYEST